MTPSETRLLVEQLIQRYPGDSYVYILRQNDRVQCWGGFGTPFYVGVGSVRNRPFAHEKAAGNDELDSRGRPRLKELKSAIRSIWARSGAVSYSIDSFWPGSERYGLAAQREIFLIAEIGLLGRSHGLLVNKQAYKGRDEIARRHTPFLPLLPVAESPAHMKVFRCTDGLDPSLVDLAFSPD